MGQVLHGRADITRMAGVAAEPGDLAVGGYVAAWYRRHDLPYQLLQA